MNIKNGDFVIQGKRVDELDIYAFDNAADMTAWELGTNKYNDAGGRVRLYMSIYETYDMINGPGACDRDGIEEIRDIFGNEFHEAFFKHKNKLIALDTLHRLRQELSNINAAIDEQIQIISEAMRDLRR